MKVQGFETAESRREDAVDLHAFVFADFCPSVFVLGTGGEFRDEPFTPRRGHQYT